MNARLRRERAWTLRAGNGARFEVRCWIESAPSSISNQSLTLLYSALRGRAEFESDTLMKLSRPRVGACFAWRIGGRGDLG
jgi:hypothetical protein